MNTPHPAPAATPGAAVIAIELAGCRTKADLLARIASAMRFPDWFGHNWDALADCLTDLSWLPAPAYVLELRHFGDLRSAAPDAAGTLLEILAGAAAFWTDQGIGFDVVDMDGTRG
ncbi:barstar family protein [Thauera sinica]|uniref:Barstar family protein n=1 Tax=Thauera sinica TaxID=2665146 RepID=A0ABW1AYC9_9RHOO|nr:barstar family protein [Thauera sp. K11]ATE59041.1 barnase inhibitor [Thauera sp. K11]